MDVNWYFTASNYEEFTAQELSQGKRVMGSTCLVFKQTNPWLYWLPEVRYFCVKNQLKIVLVWAQSYHLRIESKNQTKSNRYTHKQDTYDVPSTDMPPWGHQHSSEGFSFLTLLVTQSFYATCHPFSFPSVPQKNSAAPGLAQQSNAGIKPELILFSVSSGWTSSHFCHAHSLAHDSPMQTTYKYT